MTSLLACWLFAVTLLCICIFCTVLLWGITKQIETTTTLTCEGGGTNMVSWVWCTRWLSVIETHVHRPASSGNNVYRSNRWCCPAVALPTTTNLAARPTLAASEALWVCSGTGKPSVGRSQTARWWWWCTGITQCSTTGWPATVVALDTNDFLSAAAAQPSLTCIHDLYSLNTCYRHQECSITAVKAKLLQKCKPLSNISR